MPHMTDDQRAEAARRYVKGDMVYEIAATYRVDRGTIQRLMGRMKIEKRRRGQSGKDIQRIRAEEESRRKEIKSLGAEGPFGGALAGKVTTFVVVDDPVADCGDDGELAQVSRSRRRDDILESISAETFAIIRGRSA